MFSVNIDPVLFSIGGLEIRWYGLVYVLGVVLVYFYLKKRGGLGSKKLEKLMFYLVVGMFLGSRVFALNLVLLREPLELFRVWNGGMSFFGGFFGMVLGGWWVLRKKILEVGDWIVVPVSFVLILGRLANFVNHELVGRVTDVGWCFKFLTAEGCRHPYQLYSAFGHLILFLFLYWRSKKEFRKGEVFFSFVLGYGILRVVLDFFKERAVIFGNLSVWQMLGILFFIVGIFYFLKKRKGKER